MRFLISLYDEHGHQELIRILNALPMALFTAVAQLFVKRSYLFLLLLLKESIISMSCPGDEGMIYAKSYP